MAEGDPTARSLATQPMARREVVLGRLGREIIGLDNGVSSRENVCVCVCAISAPLIFPKPNLHKPGPLSDLPLKV